MMHLGDNCGSCAGIRPLSAWMGSHHCDECCTWFKLPAAGSAQPSPALQEIKEQPSECEQLPQQQHEANQIALDGSLCGLPQAHDPMLLGSPKSQARACAVADAGAGSKKQASQPQHRQEFLKEVAPSRGISPFETFKEHARQVYAQQQELKAVKTQPAQDSTAALTKAGTAQPVSQQSKVVSVAEPGQGITSSGQTEGCAQHSCALRLLALY